MLTYPVQPLTPGQSTPFCLIPLHNKSRTHKMRAAAPARAVWPTKTTTRLPQNLHKLMKSRPALSLLVMLAWLYVTQQNLFSSNNSVSCIPLYTLYTDIQNQIIKEIIIQTTKRKLSNPLPHTQNKCRPSAPQILTHQPSRDGLLRCPRSSNI